MFFRATLIAAASATATVGWALPTNSHRPFREHPPRKVRRRTASLDYPSPADRRKGHYDQPHLPGHRNSRYITRQHRRGYPQRAGPSGRDDTRTRLVRGAVRPRPPGGRGRRTLPGDAKGRLPARGRLGDRLAPEHRAGAPNRAAGLGVWVSLHGGGWCGPNRVAGQLPVSPPRSSSSASATSIDGPAPSCTAESGYQSQLGVDGLDVTHRSLGSSPPFKCRGNPDGGERRGPTAI
jgi:hypothetical protein